MMRSSVLRSFGILTIIVGAASTAVAIVQPRAVTSVTSATRLTHPANIFVKDERIPITPDAKHFFYLSPIGALVTNKPIRLGGEYGFAASTGFMVSPCHVLTAYHAVFGDSSNPNNVDFSDTLYLGFDKNRKARFRAEATPAIWGSGIGVRQDWALLQISPCRGANSAIGWMTLGTLAHEHWGSQGLPVELAGFMGDKPNGQMYLDSACHLYEVTQGDEFSHDCAMVSGASGSPIFIMKPGGLPEVVGINDGNKIPVDGISKGFSEDISNEAVNIDDIRAEEPGFQREINRGLQFFASKVPGAHNPQLDMLKAENNSP